MRAWVLHEVGNITYDEVAVPELREKTALVRVRAAGICGSDIPRIYRNGTYHFPTIPGHEFSGEVAEVYEGADAGEKEWIGKRVGVFPLIPCGACEPCRKKLFEMCRSYSYLGSREDGGFGEYVRVPLWNLLELPEEVSFRQAAMLEPMAVAVHAIRKAFSARFGQESVKAGRERDAEVTVAVLGLGTIGMLIVMFLQAMGFSRQIGIGNKDFQREIFLEVTQRKGRFIDSRTCGEIPAALLEVSGGRGADVFFECVGRTETIRDALASAAPGGSVQLVGNPASDIGLSRDVYWQILRRQLIVTGTWNSSFTREEDDDWHFVLRELSSGRVRPEKLITRCCSMEELGRGFEVMRDKTEPYIKIMGEYS